MTTYNDLRKVIIYYLNKKEIGFNEDEIEEAILYQKCRIPQLSAPPEREESFNYNFQEYFEKNFSDFPESLNLQPQNILVKQKDFQASKQTFAKEIIL